jgi:hypothetical protein
MENENVEQKNYTQTSHCAISKLQPCKRDGTSTTDG